MSQIPLLSSIEPIKAIEEALNIDDAFIVGGQMLYKRHYYPLFSNLR